MPARSDALSLLQQQLIAAGGGYLRNAVNRPGLTCAVCRGIPNSGYQRCWNCEAWMDRQIADRLGFVTYAWSGHQSGRTMLTYKEPGKGSALKTVTMMMAYAAVGHWPCIAHGATSPDAWTFVPSLKGRTAPHPLGTLARSFMGRVPYIPINAAPDVLTPRDFRPTNFTVAPRVAGHILLLDDTWTGGGHVQSAAGALKQAGAQRVTALIGARWLKPSFGNTEALINSLPAGFDPDICPFTGVRC